MSDVTDATGVADDAAQCAEAERERVRGEYYETTRLGGDLVDIDALKALLSRLSTPKEETNDE